MTESLREEIPPDVRKDIEDEVERLYTEVARQPRKDFHIPVGKDAALYVGYSREEIESLPETAYESFAGVGRPFDAGEFREGETVLDVGSGSGTDVLLASQMVGETGRVIGLDINDAMLDKLRVSAERAGARNIVRLKGNAQRIELPANSVHAITSNGIINLIPNKRAVFREFYRVLKPAGRMQIADIVVEKEVPPRLKTNPTLWAECIVGAERESDYLNLISEAGFTPPSVVKRLDIFARSSNPETREAAADYGAISIVLRAEKTT